MKKCKYCGRYYSQYETCPGCGSVRFEEVRNHGAIRIDKVPADGYKIDMSNIKRDGSLGKIFKFIGGALITYSFFIFMIVYLIVFILSIESNGIVYEDGTSFFDLVILFSGFSIIIPSPFIGILFYYWGSFLSKNNKITNENLERLRKNGVLIKNLRYSMHNNQIEILYETHSGVKVPFKSTVLYNIPRPLPATCDILFDRDDPGIYYIGFDIY